MMHLGVVMLQELHNICIDDSGYNKIMHVHSQSIPELG
jgi:hypothetical protein